MTYTDIKLQTLRNKEVILLLQNNIGGGIGSIMGDKYVKSDGKKILYIDGNILYGHSMSQLLPYDETEIDKIVNMEDILNTLDDSDYGYFFEVALSYPDKKVEKTKNFPFCPENTIHPDKYNGYMKKIKLKNYVETKKLMCDWTDKKKYFTHYRMSKLYIREGMVVDKVLDMILFKQSTWLEKYICFNFTKTKSICE